MRQTNTASSQFSICCFFASQPVTAVAAKIQRPPDIVVYLADDIKLDRLCALKVLRSDALADTDAIARFHREATNASRIVHPHVVAIYNFDETDDRLTYLAMEYVEGEDLSDRLARGAIPVGQLLPIARQIAEALEEAPPESVLSLESRPDRRTEPAPSGRFSGFSRRKRTCRSWSTGWVRVA